MSAVQIILFVAVLFWMALSIRGVGNILALSFLPTWSEIGLAVAISFTTNGVLVGGITGLAYAATLFAS